MRSADENVLVNLVCEFRNRRFQAVLSLLFDITYNTALYELQVGIYYECPPESKNRFRDGLLLPERESLVGKFFEHPAYVPYLPQEVFTFTLKGFLGGRRFKSDAELNDVFKEWLNGLAAEVYGEDTQKHVTGYDKCMNVGGDCIENGVESVIMIL